MLEFSALLTNSNRSKAYIQNLLKNGFIPKEVLVLQDQKQILPEQAAVDSVNITKTNQTLIRRVEGIEEYFDEKEQVIITLGKNNIKYKIIDTIDINCSKVIEEVKKMPTEYIIYSGPGGYILKNEILSAGKKFIHVHSGDLPQYRGSTTMYYSMLIDSNIGCSVIILDEEIDTGSILYKKLFKLSDKYLNYDLIFDPIARASTLIEFLKGFNGQAIIEKGEPEAGNTFYIIHPVLKHLAILKTSKNKMLCGGLNEENIQKQP